MKLIFFIIFCIFITLQYEPVRGGLVKDIFGQVHDTAKQVGSVFYLNKKNENKTPDDFNKAKETDNKHEIKPEEDHKENDDTLVKKPEENEDKHVEPVQNPKQDDKKTEDKPKESNSNENIASVVTSTIASTTQGGRENFLGACAPGYVRTADGRCKPSF